MVGLADDFVYDPFAPDVMADPHPYYAVLRDRFPVYYAAKYDTFFLSRFQDAWDFLAITDNVFVATEGTNMERDVLLQHNDAAVPELPLTPLGNHIYYGSPTYEQLRQAHGRPLRPNAVRRLADFIRTTVTERLDLLLDRGASTSCTSSAVTCRPRRSVTCSGCRPRSRERSSSA